VGGIALKPPQTRQLTELKSGFRGDSHLIKSAVEGKSIINATHLRKAFVGDESNYKSPSGFGVSSVERGFRGGLRRI